MTNALSAAMTHELPGSQSAVFIILLPLLIVTFAGAVCIQGCSRRYALIFWFHDGQFLLSYDETY